MTTLYNNYMLKLYESITRTPILSLRAGGPIAHVVRPIINPNNLHIDGWYVEDNRSQELLVLLSSDIREVIPQGFAIDDYEKLSSPQDLVRLKSIMKLRFNLVGLKLTTESGQKYGKINDYAFNTDTMYIHKLYASQSLVKNFGANALSIDRSQIIEVTDKRVIIEDPLEKLSASSKATSIAIA